MATAVPSHANLLRQQIEQTLAGRVHARLSLAPRLVREGWHTGYETLDAILLGGLPIAGTSEIVGSRSSGRATFAAAYLAERTREGHVCAWIDVAGDMTPEAAMADGMDLERVLWIRCAEPATSLPPISEPIALPVLNSAVALNDTQHALQLVTSRTFPKRDKSIGTPGAPNRVLGVAKEVRTVQVASDRQPKRRGEILLKRTHESPQNVPQVKARPAFAPAKRPWARLEQAVKAVDLLVQAGGFGAIVLDLGSMAAEVARKIPLSTWFRWRAALERTSASLLVLSPMGCAGSSAELMLRVEADLPPHGTVLEHIPYRLEVVRRRFAQQEAFTTKRPPSRASAWESRPEWAVS